MADYLSDYQRLRCRRNLLNDRIRRTQNQLTNLNEELAQNQRDTAQYERDFIAEHAEVEYDEMCRQAEAEGVRWYHVDSYDLWNSYQRGGNPDVGYDDEQLQDDLGTLVAWVAAPPPLSALRRRQVERISYVTEDNEIRNVPAPVRGLWADWMNLYGPGGSMEESRWTEPSINATIDWICGQMEVEGLALEDL